MSGRSTMRQPGKRSASQVPWTGTSMQGESAKTWRTCGPRRDLPRRSRPKRPPARYVWPTRTGSQSRIATPGRGWTVIGQVEDRSRTRERHAEIATALIRHSADIARSDGAGSMVIVVDQANTAKEMYSALGWRPVVMCRQDSKQGRLTDGAPIRVPRSGRLRAVIATAEHDVGPASHHL